MKTSTSPLRRRADPALGALAVRRRLAWPLLALLLLLPASAGWAATTRTVTSLGDSGPGTLRETIAASAAGDTIEFAVTGTITLTSGELTINRTLNINGPGPANLTVSGNRASRVFRILFGPVTISGLTITEGYAFGLNGADGLAPAQPGTAGQGGAIFNGDNLTLVNCFVVGNLARGGTGGGGGSSSPAPGGETGLPGASGGPGMGGGVYNNGSLTVSNSTFYQNACVGGKGGIGGLIRGIFGSGGDGGPGGAARGGGIYNDGTLMLLNSTFTEIQAGGGVGGDGGFAELSYGGAGGAGGSAFGGGVYGFSGSAAVNCTISGNSAAGGSGGAGGFGGFGGPPPGVNGSGEVGGVDVLSLASARMINTIVAGNNGLSPDVSGSVMSQGHNFIGKTNGSSGWVASDITGSMASPRDPQLRPLQDAGGPTPTMPLYTTSPAIDAGDDAVLGPPYSLVTDQRGAPRRNNAHVDIGAYEFGAPLPPGPGKLQLSSAAYSVAEEADTLLITVLRSLGSLGVVTVDYATSDGTATAPSDYAAASGTLVFANGEVSKTISIRINNDGSLEGNEVFNLTLSSLSNTVLAPGTAQVTILDNERPQRLVTTFNDSGGGSLRQAIAIANSGDLILFAPVVRGIIRLTSGELLIDKPLSILGPGAAALAISGNTNSRVFHIGELNGDVNISGLTITEGRVVGTNGANGVGPGSGQDGESACGGGVWSEGRLTLSDCMITTNSVAGGRGGDGGVFGSTFPVVGNGGAGGGGFGSGIYTSEGFLEVRRCAVLGNVASGGSGGAGGLNGLNNRVGNGGAGGPSLGGGVFELGSSALENCTVSGNQTTGGRGGNGGRTNSGSSPGPGNGGNGGAARGGALHGAFVLSSCTIAANASLGSAGGSHTAPTGVDGVPGTVDGAGVFATPSLAVLSTLIAGNTGSSTSPDVAGLATSAGWNLIGITDGSSGWTTNDFLGNSSFPLSALLGPCQDNSGPVWTMCPLSGSPARDQGRSDLATDARGGRRILDFPAIPNAPGGDGSDIGALEVDSLFRITSITKSNSFTRVKFKTDPGNTYRLQQSSAVTNRVWTNIAGTVTGNGQDLEATDFGPFPTARFYRVRAD